MKLLLIDDEELTRKGMIAAIDWASLDIHTVIEAEDGQMGLTMARAEKPDIILSDIRMPRLNGIEMVERIREFLPQVSVIFMSGYSDREYLKAAIRLKAISYVEKPINALEVETAILEAVENNIQLKRARQSEAVHLLAQAGQLALSMTYAPEQRAPFTPDGLSHIGGNIIKPSMTFTTIIIKTTGSLGDIPTERLQQIHENFNGLLEHYHLQELHIVKHDQHLVYHVFGTARPEVRTLLRIGEWLRQSFMEISPFFIAIGDTVSNIEQVYKSYHSAVILLQSSFFHDNNSILIKNETDSLPSPAFSDPTAAYAEALLSKEPERISKIEDDIYAAFQNNQTLLPNRVKDIYYKLFVTIQNTCRQLSLDTSKAFSSSDTILEYVQNCHTLWDLHKLLKEKSLILIQATRDLKPENPTILSIKEFINRNYQWENLSVKEISDYVHMSSSYVCTLFKNETDQTLNQYITNYRIEKAKLLLADSQYKITDISAKVGYTDGNYFGKCFKKQVGLSPSEYREKMLL